MCVILPVDYILCTHTVAIWQHCAKAPKVINGLRPCSRIRQHARPILTRKLCHNCGGPRYFARRGGLADQGRGSPISDVREEKEEQSEPYDSGYQSDVIYEEDEEDEQGKEHDDGTISPTAVTGPAKRWQDAPRQYSSSSRSPSRPSSWRPNLKRDMSAESTWYRADSIDFTMSRSDAGTNLSSRPASVSDESTPLDGSTVPILQIPAPKRKSSTLLHPSPPLDSVSDTQITQSIVLDEPTPPATPFLSLDTNTQRQSLTFLDASSPDSEATIVPSAKSFAFTLPPPTPPEEGAIPTTRPRRPDAPPRNNSTLLHPSSPTESPRSSVTDTPPVILSTPPTPGFTPAKRAFERPISCLHSALSDDEWEQPLHSSHSDVEYESDDHSAEGDTESFTDYAEEQVVVARTGRMARASRISFHGHQLRILQN